MGRMNVEMNIEMASDFDRELAPPTTVSVLCALHNEAVGHERPRRAA
jgi:hypothetical protein